MTGPSWLRGSAASRPAGAAAGTTAAAVLAERQHVAVAQAQADGIPVADVADSVGIASYGFGGADLEALESLLAVETGLMVDDDDPGDQQIQEGRHRITAMRDTGVQRTVLVRLELIDAAADSR